MKTLIVFVVAIGLASAQISWLTSALQTLNLGDLDRVRSLFNDGGDDVLKRAATLFVGRFEDSELLKGMSVFDITKNFIDNARRIVTQQDAAGWKSGLDMETLGLSQEQFRSLLTLRAPSQAEGNGTGQQSIGSSAPSRKKRALPSSVDWRSKGAVTAIKNQGSCGSCWAFAAAGALEGRAFVKTGKLPTLSEQNLIDCAKNVSGKGCCAGCGGGWITDGYTYVQGNDGINSLTSYPYEAKDATCRYNAGNKAGTAAGFVNIPKDDETALMTAVAAGPVAAAIDATQFQTYKSGILSCLTVKELNHGITIVGYGTTFLLGDYWIVKNSWGASWGENGYVKVSRKLNCGIDTAASYPLV